MFSRIPIPFIPTDQNLPFFKDQNIYHTFQDVIPEH